MNERLRRNRRTKTAATVTLALVAGWIALAACSNNGEGERCEVENNSDDCQDGLICLAASQVNLNYNNSDRCCPVDRSKATHPACTLLQSPVAGDSAPPADTGPAATDSGSDTGLDSGTKQDADADAGEQDAADAADQ